MRNETRTERVDAAVAALASKQWGVITAAQVASLGVNRSVIHRRMHAGRWVRLHSGIYAIAGYPPVWRQSLMAAVLSVGPDAVASHEAAATLHRLAGFRDPVVEVSVARAAGTRCFAVHRVRSLEPADVGVVEAIPVTRVERTLLDLAAREPSSRIEAAFDDALRRGLTTLPRLRWRLSAVEGRGRRGRVVIQRLIDARSDGRAIPASPLETKTLAMMRSAGLPEPERQHEIVLDGRRMFLDFAYPHARIVIEADGYRYHAGRSAWANDLARRNALTAAGWRVLHLTWDDVTGHRHRTAARIRAMLTA